MDSRTWFRSAALIFACALAGSVHAQDGAYDPTFGNVGRAWIDVTSSTSDVGVKLIRLPNGNFFMAGACNSVSCAAWLTPSGSLATGYGTAGTGTASFSDFTAWPPDDGKVYDAAAFLDGRVVLPVGINVSHVAVLRADGTGLDAAVGNGVGYIAPPFFYAELVRVTPQQKVIVVGSDRGAAAGIVVARYDSTLHLDTPFGNGGSTTIGFPGEDTYPFAMTLQKDGKIVVLASNFSSGALDIVRLTAGGSPDPDFGINSDGRFESFFGFDYAVLPHDIVVDKQGRLVFVGELTSATGGEWFVNRLLGGGATDATFNGGQPRHFTIFSTSQSGGSRACCVAVQNDGRIVAAGTVDRPSSTAKYFALARFTDMGAFDSTYGIGGQSYGDMSPQPDSANDSPQSMAVVPGGIVIGGATTVTGGEIRFSATKVLIDPLFASDFE